MLKIHVALLLVSTSLSLSLSLFLSISLPPSLSLTLYTCAYTHLRKGRALHVFDGMQLSHKAFPCFLCDGPLLVFGKFLHGGGVISQVNLSPHQQERRPLTVVCNLRHPLNNKNLKHHSVICLA